ncbi:MAG: YggS family pyridoxal phosphate-dependent enzyme [Chloroflexi bacterium]|nr:YggS family pyridoxal phosphate-dependent enzyme [Ardenticatenaceae bacterium]MBL1127815.1 YggS family pyridoxal phosphate-dependent enzyme [Chloroflexota bacterium]NOG33884.1 YggS family pyridoxal phosphate-dependent enzyme [Chloroflexota bacterium]GIK54785.1 MAG: YggS family pyridoxal phosphate enzyme [Chloroflexota bacterium]
MDGIVERVTAVHQRIASAAARVGRDPAQITLVAVTKTWPPETVLAAYAAGLRHFGENRAEELAEKRPYLESHLDTKSAKSVTWHLIGTLQSRKTPLAATHADVFHALDRLKIAHRLARDLAENGRATNPDFTLPIFLEVNVSGESSKSGFDCTRWEEDGGQTGVLRAAAAEVISLPGLMVAGLMTMAPWDAPPEEIRAIFRRTRQLAARLQSDLTLPNPLQLSMGMTDDFEIAIEEGATHVRVGRAIFGERP